MSAIRIYRIILLIGLWNSLTRVQRNRIFKIANPSDKWFRLSDLDISTSFITDYYRTELKIPFHIFSGATGPVTIDGIYLRISKSVISNFIYQIMSALKCICRSVEFGYLFCQIINYLFNPEFPLFNLCGFSNSLLFIIKTLFHTVWITFY